MNVSCPECRTVYRVDPRKVPALGVRARCVRCPGEFDLEGEAPQTETAPDPATVESEGVVDEGSAGQEQAYASEDVATTPEPVPEAQSEPAPETEPVAGNRFASSEEELPPPPFGSLDPDSRARRLARALVSDIVVYHPERRERSLRQGTIRQDFRDEIRKSWDEYVAQVGNETARRTSYFQEALNEILAGGARLF